MDKLPSFALKTGVATAVVVAGGGVLHASTVGRGVALIRARVGVAKT